MRMNVLPSYVYMLGAHGSQTKASDSLEMELPDVVSLRMGAGNPAQALMLGITVDTAVPNPMLF